MVAFSLALPLGNVRFLSLAVFWAALRSPRPLIGRLLASWRGIIETVWLRACVYAARYGLVPLHKQNGDRECAFNSCVLSETFQ